MFQRNYQFCLFIFLFKILDSKGLGFKEAIGILANQTLITFSNLLSKCEHVPVEIQNGGKKFNFFILMFYCLFILSFCSMEVPKI